MQEKKDRIVQFLERFRKIEDISGHNVAKACAFLGISRSLFYAIISEEKPITDKVWRKLEAAEKSAGVVNTDEANSVKLTELEGDEKSNDPDRMTQLEAKVELLTRLVEKLLEQRAMSSKDHGPAVETTRKKIS